MNFPQSRIEGSGSFFVVQGRRKQENPDAQSRKSD